ncbi:hypothetical protein AAZX31_08G129300 [Glycine max]|uniref:Late embryogenesis abundant protein LEA-2 subgroup domain-containing protein n=2 Tax=Glycine subgen. Soja TaxID=1462606 RepID=I1KSW4_SOYBN|nr:NDR1/HIN1-like protein 13 [Glycine max]XP_028243713.1 NDR1/HIN1-like protein 13 [Glycine soja]KAG5000082.1 hypothetical protein JHK87_021154 [Glycine soja]KAG5015566.1 hypothetical protein JHK85_021702 [Glycine max]KAG5025347.1 hypothetical protein JHK86_021261 [Glycine max]KAG5136517.1 hypothetical protein JHK82_021248 [Glycine max]KAH1050995.1 hypothetical protein GYH30_021106 [Glycine max]|eukprot:XP_003532809.1 NDR1/HIN1-like protein 13 [Glycine max]
MSRRETNPHFSRSSQPEYVDDHDTEPYPLVPRRKRHGKPSTQVAAPIPVALPPEHEDRVPLRTRPQHEDHVPLQPATKPIPQDHPHPPPPIPQEPRHGKQRSPRRQPTNQGFRPVKPKVNFQEPPPSADVPPEPRQQPHRDPRLSGIKLPKEQKSQPLTWLGACLCVIFWLIIIIGGLIVLIVYLVFRPQSPHFDVSSVTLNAAYLDLGYLLNADLTMLANFTNPNKKVHVDFSSVIIYLYYGSTLIATQYVEPFNAARLQSRFAYIHLVSSQVQLPLRESQRLVKQMEGNGVILEVRGVFRARSKLGSILRYSYNLYGRCSVMLTRPPDGILLKKKCRTKR